MVEWNLENYRAEQPASQAQPLIPAAADRLGEIQVPTLVAWGTLDTPGVISACKRIAAEVPGARSHVFEGVAHMVNLERPAEFNQLVGDFLAEVDRLVQDHHRVDVDARRRAQLQRDHVSAAARPGPGEHDLARGEGRRLTG